MFLNFAHIFFVNLRSIKIPINLYKNESYIKVEDCILSPADMQLSV